VPLIWSFLLWRACPSIYTPSRKFCRHLRWLSRSHVSSTFWIYRGARNSTEPRMRGNARMRAFVRAPRTQARTSAGRRTPGRYTRSTGFRDVYRRVSACIGGFSSALGRGAAHAENVRIVLPNLHRLLVLQVQPQESWVVVMYG